MTFLRGLAGLVMAALLIGPAFAASSEASQEERGWREVVAPFKIVGPIDYVGTRGLSSWLITTTDGDILINSGAQGSGLLVEHAIRELGHKPEDIKIILFSHSHYDHVGGLAYLKRISGAKVIGMRGDADVVESGGATDFAYANDPLMQFEPIKVDEVIDDGAQVTLGDVTLTALKTAGHTKGSTTFTTTVMDDGRAYNVVFADGTNVNATYRLARGASYEGIADDFRHTFKVLAGLTPDIWLTPHPDHSNFWAKHARAETEGVEGWVDPQGYRDWVDAQEARFRIKLARDAPQPKRPRKSRD